MNSEIKSGRFFVFNEETNSFEKLGEISGEITATNTEPETSPSEKLKQLNKDFATSFEVQIDDFNKYAFYLLIGEKYRIPNNWLKHHGEPWTISLALAREFFGIPTVPEYSVEYYRKFRTKGGANDG